MTVLRLCLGASAVCLAISDCDRAQAADAQAPIQQAAAANHSPVHLTPATGLKKLESRANRGDAASQYELGVRYAKADGPPMAKQEAVVWYRRAAEQAFAKAQAALGRCYASGEGVAQDYDQATKWYRKAAEQGHALAQYNLGSCYVLGQGVQRNYAEAAKWYRKAAEQGDADAQCNLGVFYASGQGVAQDYREAVKWYRKAAEQGDARGQTGLGVCYVEGQGVAKNYWEGVKWFRKALEQGSELARTDLARAKENLDANWYKDVSQGGTTRTIQGPHQVPMPDPTPDERVAGENPSEEAGKIRILSDIVSDYHRNHTYIDGGVFVCGDMACDVWNMVKTKGIAAKIQVGNVDRHITSLHEANHAWVMAETSPGCWLALETTAGRVVHRNENEEYYSGWSFANPKEFREFNNGHR